MKSKSYSTLFFTFFLTTSLFSPALKADQYTLDSDKYSLEIPVPPRYQWDHNSGYCGEVSLISAGLYYGQYLSQYDARAVACENNAQNRCQLLVGDNDQYAAYQMHLNAVEWDPVAENSTKEFLEWVKQNILKGYPVVIGIFTNEFLFYDNNDPNAGDNKYDHIVPVTGIGSNHPLTDQTYHADDLLQFSDNGLWGSSVDPVYNFVYNFTTFQATRQQANAQDGAIYSISNNGMNYGIAILGVMDTHGDTLPVRLKTNINDEKPQIKEGSNVRPPSSPITLTVTISNLEPGVVYNLYRYNDLSKVPHSKFNNNSDKAFQNWNIEINSGSTFSFIQEIQSDEMAIYRAVRSDAP